MKHKLTWVENNCNETADWVTESILSVPKKILIADDCLKADDFYRQASEGTAFIYKGDFKNAKQLLQAVKRRIDKSIDKKSNLKSYTLYELFHRHRQSQAHRARILSRLLVCVDCDYNIKLHRAPNVINAIKEALEQTEEVSDGFVISLQELLGYIGAYEWRKKGVYIEALGDRIHPYYGVFSPNRGEYLELVEKVQLSENINCAFDIGTGSGVIAAILAKRGVKRVVATDLDRRSLVCAQNNLLNLGYDKQVELIETDLFPPGKADLIVCNPPWMPVRPTSRIEYAVYDENSQMLKRFLSGACDHLSDDGEVWLIISDLAERIGLRGPHEIKSLISQSGLKIVELIETRPKHSKASDENDPLYAARSRESTKLFRLKPL